MKYFAKAFLCSGAAFAWMAVWPAQDKKSAPGTSKILQPQMTVETGSYTPAGKLGDQPDQPWSAATLGASVDGKPNPGGMARSIATARKSACATDSRSGC